MENFNHNLQSFSKYLGTDDRQRKQKYRKRERERETVGRKGGKMIFYLFIIVIFILNISQFCTYLTNEFVAE